MAYIDLFCLQCGFYDPDFVCTCPSSDLWYACPLSADPDLDRMLEEWGNQIVKEEK